MPGGAAWFLSLSDYLPHLRGLRLECVFVAESGLTLGLTTTRRTAHCPLCSRRSRGVHSRYQRTLADVPWGGRSVVLHVQVRRFFCRNRRCPRAIFAERLPQLVTPRARRTLAQHALLLDLACALGGQPGARLARRHGLQTSGATLLRLIARAPLPPVGAPRVVGVDDWSQRRGHTYGTILVDADQRRPIELLPDRTADTLASWLEIHPSIELVTRDRSTAYAEGAARGAPQAVQVADRFHVIDDLGEAVEQVLDRHRSALRELTVASPREPIVAARPVAAGPRGRGSTRQERHLRQRRALRIDRYERLQVLKSQGWTIGAMARELGISRRTIERWNRSHGFPERKPRRDSGSPLSPYADYLSQCWDQGCHKGLQLWRAACEHGYSGPRSAIWPVLHRLRQGLKPIGDIDLSAHRRLVSRPPSPRRMAGVWLRRAGDRTEAEQRLLQHLLELCPDARLAFGLTERFLQLVRERQAHVLDAWLEDAAAAGLPEFRSFATGLQRDKAAIVAAASLPYSNGQTEGQITKLKLLKRSMYGRASFALLRRRVLLAV
ncbi:MAG: ISL3 family transposase [Chloroflexota bacterium]|nr:ISL3 family transposase [Chloroflexota bacterium]